MNNIKVATVLVNYFGAKDTALCIESLEGSDEPASIIVVDNSPNDPELGAVLKCHPDVHLIKAPENLGFGRGNNLGIDWVLENTDSEFIFIFNNDATVKPDTIGHLVQAMEEHPEAGIVSPRIVFSEEPNKLWYGGGEVDWKRGGGRVPGVLGSADEDLAMTARHVSFATGCAMFFRRDILAKEKGFDDRFFMYEEDLELSLRVQESGWKIWYEPKALAYHIGQGSQRNGGKFVFRLSAENQNLNFLAYQSVKNRLLNMNMHARGRNRVAFKIIFPVFILNKSVVWCMHGRFDACRSAVCAVFDYWKVR